MSDRSPALLAFTSFERALLRSADQDEAPAGGAERVMSALGVTAALPNPANAACETSASSANTAWSLWQKPLVIGVLGGVGFVLSARFVAGPEAVESRSVRPAPLESRVKHAPPAEPALTAEHQAVTKTVPTAPRSRPTPKRAAPAVLTAPGETAIVESLPVLENEAPAPVPDRASSPTEPPPPNSARGSDQGAGSPATSRSASIAAEVVLVDRARAAMKDGRTREALTELARYRQQWPLGVLTPEVTLLQIEAELRLGERASAVRRAREMIAAQPSGRYAARLRTLFDPAELQ
jgi:hypothetical protein